MESEERIFLGTRTTKGNISEDKWLSSENTNHKSRYKFITNSITSSSYLSEKSLNRDNVKVPQYITPLVDSINNPERNSTTVDFGNPSYSDICSTLMQTDLAEDNLSNDLGMHRLLASETEPSDVESPTEICVNSKRFVHVPSSTFESASESSALRPPMTKKQKLTLFSLILSCVLDSASFSILIPFFPVEARNKGVSPIVTGFIFSVYALVNFIMSPICGKYLSVIGPNIMFLSGLFIAGSCNILFGILSELPDGHIFILSCFVVRTVEAVGGAAALTASLAIVTKTYPNRVARIVGLMETAGGIGFMLGPPAGAILYQFGGYQLPFICLGVFVILSVIINKFLLSSDGIQPKATGSLCEVLKIVSIWPTLVGLFIGATGIGFLDPTFSLYMQQFNVSPLGIGLLFFLCNGIYAVSSPLIGCLIDYKDVVRILMMIGFFISSLGYLLVGTSQIFKLPKEVWVVAVGFSLLGVGWGCTLVPPFQDMIVSSVRYGLPDNLQTQGVISGLYSSIYALGCFFGPSMAGIMIDHLGFEESMSILAAACIMVTIGQGLFYCWEFQCSKGKRKPQEKHWQVKNSIEQRELLLPSDDSNTSVAVESTEWELDTTEI